MLNYIILFEPVLDIKECPIIHSQIRISTIRTEQKTDKKGNN